MTIIISHKRSIVSLPSVAVIIPTWNNAIQLRICLAALARQTYPLSLVHFIVAINGDPTGYQDLISEFKNVTWVTETRPGSYAARNRGIKEAQAAIIAFTDSDCVPSEGWLEQGVKALLQSEYTLIGGHIQMFGRADHQLRPAEIFEASMFDMIRHQKMIEENGFAVTANLFAFRSVFDRNGLFDSRLKSSGDREWTQRCLRNGERLGYAPSASISHPRRESFQAVWQKVKRLKGGWIQLAKMRRSPIELRVAMRRLTLLDPKIYSLAFSKQCPRHQAVSVFCGAMLIGVKATVESVCIYLGRKESRG